MLKPGTNHVLCLQGINIEGNVEMVLMDFRTFAGLGTPLGAAWLPIFPKAYSTAVAVGLVEQVGADNFGEEGYVFTKKGKSIFALWQLLLESGAAPEPFKRDDDFRIHPSKSWSR